MHVLAYGSLLCPTSLRATLPGAAVERCLPVRCTGFSRTFDVAFPNDGSQPDKAYFDDSGRRPPFVLFANLQAQKGATVNGVCVPVSEADLDVLQNRERRYDLVDVSGMTLVSGGAPPPGRVLAFLGRDEFTAVENVRDGVVAQSYADTIVRGARFWDRRAPGFLAEYLASTRPAALARLRRVDHTDPGRGSCDVAATTSQSI